MLSCRRTEASFFFFLLSSLSCLEADRRQGALAGAVAPVPGAPYPGLDGLPGHLLAVCGQAQEAHEIDEVGGEVQRAAQLAG